MCAPKHQTLPYIALHFTLTLCMHSTLHLNCLTVFLSMFQKNGSVSGQGRIDCHGILYFSLLLGKNKQEYVSRILTVQFIAQIRLHNVGVVKSDSNNRGTEIAKYYSYQAQICVEKKLFTILSRILTVI